MNENTQRQFVKDGQKKGITLDASTWRGIDWIAEQQGVKWADLARAWIAERPTEQNMTRAVRAGMIDTLMAYPIFEERAQQMDEQSDRFDPLRERLQEVHQDEAFTYALEQAEKHGQVFGHYPFGGFNITTGVSEFGNVTFYIENGVKGCPNAIIDTGIKLAAYLAGKG